MAEREEEPDADRASALLHELARRIVDRGDMVGVDGVAQTERIGEEGRTEQDGVAVKGDEGPDPNRDIGGDEKGGKSDQATANG